MKSRAAIVFALDAIIYTVEGPTGYRWEFDPRLPGLLRDYKAMGYRLIGLLDPMAFGLDIEGAGEEVELVSYINGLLTAAGAPALDAINLSSDVTDPRPIWDLRRRFGLSLGHSVLVGTGDQYEELQRNAGIGRLEWAQHVLGPIYQQAAAG